jgi:hypothetical protein
MDTLHDDQHAFLQTSGVYLIKYLPVYKMLMHKSYREKWIFYVPATWSLGFTVRDNYQKGSEHAIYYVCR